MASVTTPTTQEINDLIVAQVESKLGKRNSFFDKTFTRVLAKALSGILILLYRYAAFIFLQMFVEFASFRETTVNGRTIVPLIELGRQLGVGDPNPDVRCEAAITVTVTNQSGELAAGSQLVNNDTGLLYTVVSAVPLDSSAVLVDVRATLEAAGEAGHLDTGDVLSFVNPLPNVSRDASVTFVAISGTDGESEADYRTRVRRRRQTPPQGGSYADYRLWGEEWADIRAVFPYTSDNPGEIDAYVEAVATTANPDGIPTSAQLTNVENSIQSSSQSSSGLHNRRPVLAAVNTFAIERTGFTVEVTGLSVSDQSGAKSAISSALDAYFRDRAPFIQGLSPLPRRDKITQADANGVVSGTAAAYGGSVSTVTLLVSAVEVQSYSLDVGELAKLEEDGVTYI